MKPTNVASIDPRKKISIVFKTVVTELMAIGISLALAIYAERCVFVKTLIPLAYVGSSQFCRNTLYCISNIGIEVSILGCPVRAFGGQRVKEEEVEEEEEIQKKKFQ